MIPAFILSLAAHFGSPSLARPSHCALKALREISGGATITIPGGVGTTRFVSHLYNSSSHVLGTPASLIKGRSSPTNRALALRFAPSRCPNPSRACARCRLKKLKKLILSPR
jgi:hypothetical protein